MTTIIEQLTAATEIPLPNEVSDAYLVDLTRACVAVSDGQWAQFSDEAQAWIGDAVLVIKKRAGRLTADQGANVPDEIPTLELPAPEPEPEPEVCETLAIEPEPEAKPAKKKRAKKKSATSRRGRTGRGARGIAFQKGKTYWFFDHIIGREGGIEGLRAAELAREFNAGRPDDQCISEKSATVVVYDTITVLRVLRDRGLYTHTIVSDHSGLSKDETCLKKSTENS